MEISLYDLLEVETTASSDQIDEARGRAIALHTDEWMRETGVRREHLDAAWTVLRYPDTRAQYDKLLDDGSAPPLEMMIAGGALDRELLARLFVDWADDPRPRLPVNVSEVTTWATAVPAGPAGTENKSRQRKKAERELQNMMENNGVRAPSALARTIAGIVSVPLIFVLIAGGYFVIRGPKVVLPLVIGGCAALTPNGEIAKAVPCSEKADVRITNGFSNPNLCRSDLRVSTPAQSGWTWCVDLIAPKSR